jgi:hypothetical protein
MRIENFPKMVLMFLLGLRFIVTNYSPVTLLGMTFFEPGSAKAPRIPWIDSEGNRHLIQHISNSCSFALRQICIYCGVLRYFTLTDGITTLGVFSNTFPDHKMRVHLLTAPGLLVIWAVTHPSTNRSHRCLTSVIKWVPVCQTWQDANLYCENQKNCTTTF